MWGLYPKTPECLIVLFELRCPGAEERLRREQAAWHNCARVEGLKRKVIRVKRGETKHSQLVKEREVDNATRRLTEEFREMQADMRATRLERTREYLQRRYGLAGGAQIDAAARLLVASDQTGSAAVRLSETGEIVLPDSERAEHVKMLLRVCQAGRGSAPMLTEDDAKVKRLTDQGMSEEEAWTKLAKDGDVEF